MPIYILKGNQVGEALQFVENGQTTRVEIGRVWFAETDTVRIVTTPGSVDASGTFFGGNGAVTSFSVTTAAGLTTTFHASPDGLDVDRDPTKQGPDFAYISEKPGSGEGGAYAGLNIEKIMISDVPLTSYSVLTYANGGGWVPGAGSVTPPVVTPPVGGGINGTDGNDVLTGTNRADRIDGRDGNDRISARGGKDTVDGSDGNDVIDGGAGADILRGGNGNDRLIGGRGNDAMFGGEGNDLFDGGAGRDVFTGGLGGDTFVWGAGNRVTDFNRGEGDEIHFHAALGANAADLQITTVAAGTRIALTGQSGAMILEGYFGGFDIGNTFKFDYVPSMDFL
ncbi:MAG: calcium-binding protein [Gemmobacter sp.]